MPNLVDAERIASDQREQCRSIILDLCQVGIGSKPEELVHRLISRRHTAVGDFADFQGASDEHT